MRPFEYASPGSVDEAVRLLGREDAAVLAGGTDLISLLKDDAVSVTRLVNIKEIDELNGISRLPDGGLRVGALVTLDELLAAGDLQSFPALTQAAAGIRSPQIRHMGTIGGELLQRPRCWYFRQGHGLLARLDGRSLVEEGDNRYHAVLGNGGPAYFVSPSSLAPPLMALDASVVIVGSQGRREILLADLYRTPTCDSQREHDLNPDEILTEIRVPAVAGTHQATYEVRHRESLDWPLATASVVLQMDGDVIRRARVVLGHVAPVPWPAPEAEEVLQGKAATSRVATVAGQAAVKQALGLSRNNYKIRLAAVAVKRAALLAAGEEI